MDQPVKNTDALIAALAVGRARLALEKAKGGLGWLRWPAGSKKGGQFAPKGTSGQAGPGAAGAPSGGQQHTKTNDKGQPVVITHPSRASHKSTWSDNKAVATFTPGGDAPTVLNGVKLSSWAGAKDWARAPGTDPSLDEDQPFEPTRGKAVGAGVVVLEPDGRVWLTKPTNEFGGYANTYPKGTAEPGLSLQQNAIKEAWEETGLQVKIVGILGDYERSTSKARYYIAERVGGTPADMGWESQAVRLSPLSQARKLLNAKVDQDILDDIEHVIEISQMTKASWAKQPRWPRGSALGGQWKTVGADGLTMPPVIAGGLMGKNAVYQKAVNAAHAMAQAGDLSGAQAVVAKYADANGKFLAKQLTSSHVKWGAQAHQYATQLGADHTAKSKATVTADRIAGPAKLSSFTYAAPKPGGSNPGAVYTDAKGEKWLIKGNAQLASGAQGPAISEMRARNEVLAAKLLMAAGVGAPEMKLVDLQGQHGGDLGVASKMIDHKKFNPTNDADVQKAQADFAVHAWLGNYDVLGMGYDNTVFEMVDGKAVNIDPGGALLFRAQGALKDPSNPLEGLKKDAPEFESMRKTSSEQKTVFGSMTASQLARSAEKLKGVTDAQIKDLVNTYGPGDENLRAALADRLIERRDAILQKVGVAAPATVTAPKTRTKPAKAGFTAADVMAEMNKIPDESGFSYAEVKAELDKVTALAEKKLADSPLAAPIQNAGSATSFIQAYLNNPGQNKSAQATAAHLVIAENLDKAYNKGDLFATVEASMQAKALALQAFTSGDNTIPMATTVLSKISSDKVNFLAYQKAVEAKKILEQAGPIEPPAMPVFSGKFANVNEWYGKMAQGFKALYDSGNLEGLKQAKFGGKYAGGLVWKPGFANGEAIAKYHAGLVAALEQKNAAGVMAGAKLAQEALKPVSPAVAATVAPPASKAPRSGATPAAAPAQVATPNLSAMPNFAAQLMPGDSSNAKANNNKVLALQTLAEAGDVKGILSLAYGSNTYGKKHVKLANDALAALGSPHTVSLSQKPNSHPALHGGATAAAVAAAAAATKTQAPTPHPAPKQTAEKTKADIAGPGATGDNWIKLGPNEKIIEQGEEFGLKWAKLEVSPKGFVESDIPKPPDFFATGNQGPTKKWVSSKEALNAANNAAVQAIYSAVIANKGPVDFSTVKVPQIDSATLQPTGKLIAVTELPVSGVKEYISQVTAEAQAQLKVTFKNIQSGSMQGGYAAAAVSMAQKYNSVPYASFKSAPRAADYVILSKDAASKLPAPKVGDLKEMKPESAERLKLKAASDAGYAKLTAAEKTAIVAYTGAAYGEWNEALRTGATASAAFKAAQTMVNAFAKAAIDIPPGTTIWRGLEVGKSTYDSIVGGVIQDGSFNSASYGAHPGGPGYAKGTWLRIAVPASGLKGMDVTTFSQFKSNEREIVIQNGVRYAVLKTEKFSNFVDSNGKAHGAKTIVDVIALPHLPGA